MSKKTDAIKKLAFGATNRKTRNKVPHINELCEHLINEFGGAARFAKQFHQTYLDSKEGSVIRARMLEAITRLVVTSSQLGGGNTEEMGLLSDEDLAAAAAELLGRTDATGPEQPAAAGALEEGGAAEHEVQP